MKITIMAVGSRGDVQSLVALGRGLKQAGHHVRLVAGDDFEALITAHGLDFRPLGVNMRKAMADAGDFFAFLRDITENILGACQDDADAIVATAMGVSTCEVAQECGIPFFYAVPMPSLRTRAFPDPMFPPFRLLGGFYNRLTHRIVERHSVQQYPSMRRLLETQPPYLFCFSTQVVSRPADWPDHAYITGYWLLDRPQDWQPPADLAAFIESGPPPVFVGFGSMIDADPQAMTELAVEALRRAGQRGVLLTGWGGLEGGDLLSDTFAISSAPFDWLLPKMAAVVHHGGAGTTAERLRAGAPSVIVPFGIDQPFWGRRVEALGAGPAPIPRKQLTAERLAVAIRRAVEDESMRACAAALGEKLRAEDGIGNAIAVMHQHLGLNG
jgi:sterol 3beta-glucosyltransferase